MSLNPLISQTTAKQILWAWFFQFQSVWSEAVRANIYGRVCVCVRVFDSFRDFHKRDECDCLPIELVCFPSKQ